LLDYLFLPRLSHRVRAKRHRQHVAAVGRIHATIPHILFALQLNHALWVVGIEVRPRKIPLQFGVVVNLPILQPAFCQTPSLRPLVEIHERIAWLVSSMKLLNREPWVISEPSRQSGIRPFSARLIRLGKHHAQVIGDSTTNTVAVDDDAARVLFHDPQSDAPRLVRNGQTAPLVGYVSNRALTPSYDSLIEA